MCFKLYTYIKSGCYINGTVASSSGGVLPYLGKALASAAVD